jgi:hypothetical protein
MKHKIIIAITFTALLSCEKTNDMPVLSDSIVFSANVRPRGKRFDSNDHRFLIDSFYTSTTLLTQRITLTVNDAGSVTQRIRALIDNTVIDTLFKESRMDFWQVRYFDFKRMDTIYPGWHELKFRGTSYPQLDTINIYYSVLPGDFVCTDLNGTIVPVSGLPIQVKKWYLKPNKE